MVARTYAGADGLLSALTLTAPYSRTPLPATAQGEAVGYGADSRTLRVSSEGPAAPVHRARR